MAAAPVTVGGFRPFSDRIKTISILLFAGLLVTLVTQVILFRATTTNPNATTSYVRQPGEFPTATHNDQSQPKQPARKSRQLTFQDLTLGEYINYGWVNVLCAVTLPDWWWEQEGRAPIKLLMKMTGNMVYSSYELFAMRSLNSDKEAARRHKVVELFFAEKNVTNPFKGLDPQKDIESGMDQIRRFWNTLPTKKAKYLAEQSCLAVHVVPHLDLVPSWPHNHKHIGTLHAIRLFMKSVLSQMDYALGLGINNGDLDGTSNVMYDEKDGGAIIIDWNGGQRIEEVFYTENVNFGIIPPEAWVEHVVLNGTKVQLRYANLWQYDVWSIGVLFARLIYYPCYWEDGSTFDREPPVYYDRVRAELEHIGGNVMIPVSSHAQDGEFDLAELVGLNRSQIEAKKFEPFLFQNEKHRRSRLCEETSFRRLEGASDEVKEQAVDFLKSMLTISPRDRPNYRTLLKHPFLRS